MFSTVLFYLFALPVTATEGILVGDLICNGYHYTPTERWISAVLITACGIVLAIICWCGLTFGISIDWALMLIIGGVGCAYSIVNDQLHRLNEKDNAANKGERQ